MDMRCSRLVSMRTQGGNASVFWSMLVPRQPELSLTLHSVSFLISILATVATRGTSLPVLPLSERLAGQSDYTEEELLLALLRLRDMPMMALVPRRRWLSREKPPRRQLDVRHTRLGSLHSASKRKSGSLAVAEPTQLTKQFEK